MSFTDANSPPADASSGGIGDVTSNERGSGARFNGGKPNLSLIPLRMIADSMRDPLAAPNEVLPTSLAVLYAVGEFQETGDRRALQEAIRRCAWNWEDAARVFEYGQRKYAPWNWAKGMAWSVPIACIARHAVMSLRGQQVDPESGYVHEGHILCNLVMLALYVDTYPEGNDLPAPELFRPREGACDGTMHPGEVPVCKGKVPRRSVVIYGPQMCGKTRHARKLADFFGLSKIVDDWAGEPYDRNDTLVLTSHQAAFDHLSFRAGKFHFDTAMLMMDGAGKS
jgi:hypothetical protein